MISTAGDESSGISGVLPENMELIENLDFGNICYYLETVGYIDGEILRSVDCGSNAHLLIFHKPCV